MRWQRTSDPGCFLPGRPVPVNRRRSHRRGKAQPLNHLAEFPRRRTPLPTLIWSWRKELALLGYAAILFIAVVRTFGTAWTIIGTSATVCIFPSSWFERLTAFAWQLITPHLLRSGMYQARIQNRDGRQPVIIRVTSEPFGERLRLWCPAGTSAEDLHAARGILRAACRAADVKVTRDQQRSHVVTLDVIRRPPQAGPTHGGLGTTRCGGQ